MPPDGIRPQAVSAVQWGCRKKRRMLRHVIGQDFRPAGGAGISAHVRSIRRGIGEVFGKVKLQVGFVLGCVGSEAHVVAVRFGFRAALFQFLRVVCIPAVIAGPALSLAVKAQVGAAAGADIGHSLLFRMFRHFSHILLQKVHNKETAEKDFPALFEHIKTYSEGSALKLPQGLQAFDPLASRVLHGWIFLVLPRICAAKNGSGVW